MARHKSRSKPGTKARRQKGLGRRGKAHATIVKSPQKRPGGISDARLERGLRVLSETKDIKLVDGI
jgi:hypothetical protein